MQSCVCIPNNICPELTRVNASRSFFFVGLRAPRGAGATIIAEVSMSKSKRNANKPWTREDVRQLRTLARENTPTRVIGLKLGRSADAIRTKASNENVSLKPTNQSPYNRHKA